MTEIESAELELAEVRRARLLEEAHRMTAGAAPGERLALDFDGQLHVVWRDQTGELHVENRGS